LGVLTGTYHLIWANSVSVFCPSNLNNIDVMTTLHIKNMVCPRCIMAVEKILTEAGLHPISVELGIAEIREEEISTDKMQEIDQKLHEIGFERIENRDKQLVDNIKTLIIKQIHHQSPEQGFNWSSWLAQQINHDYRFISQLFSGMEGITIEQFIIKQKIEKVKELIAYGEMNFSEIAYALGYSSPAHMSNQFKKITGMTPRQFKQLRKPQRNSIDSI
jgi:AraC-like DNA-binding protein